MYTISPKNISSQLFTGTIDGRPLALDADSGEVLLEFDTVREYDTVNRVQGIGGAIDAHVIAAGAGLLLVNSGYGQVGGTSGNVLLAFRPTEG